MLAELAGIGQIVRRRWCLARSVSKDHGTILRIDRLHTPRESETLRAAHVISQNLARMEAGSVIYWLNFVITTDICNFRSRGWTSTLPKLSYSNVWEAELLHGPR